LTHTIRNRSRAGSFLALLFFVLATLASCGGVGVGGGGAASGSDAAGPATNVTPAGNTGPTTSAEGTNARTTAGKTERAKLSDAGGDRSEQARADDKGAKKAVKPPKDLPKYRDWYEDSGSEPVQIKSAGSAGAIPAVEPFNFGKDPGGPEDKTLYLTVPRLGLEGVPVYNSTSEEDLNRSAVHVPATGFPWQKGANVFIAGHRIGYEGTGSYHIFYDMDQMKKGDEISLTDANGKVYRYRMTSLKIVDPDNVEVMNPVEGKDLISLQTCTLPDYKERVIVQGERVKT
jgi:sortase A